MKCPELTPTTAAAVGVFVIAVSALFAAGNPSYAQADASWVKIGTGDCYGNDMGTTEGVVPDDGRAREGYTAICWDGIQYNNRYNPGRAFCVYKKISPSMCSGGPNTGIMYESSGQRAFAQEWIWRGTGDCYGNDMGTTEGAIPDNSRAREGYTAICWDGVQYNNRYNPGRAFCVYKRISPSSCSGGPNTGNIYASSGQRGPGGCQVAGVTCPGPGGQGLCADPNVLAVMDEWLASATPPMRPGESLCYDCWGRKLGTTLTGTITTSQNPDTQGQTRCEWLYYLAPGLDSGNNFGTLAEYLRRQGIPR